MPSNPPHFLAIGHICHDRITNGYLPGGAAGYGGLLASRLGHITSILTSWGDDFRFHSLFEDIGTRVIPAAHTTVFENIYQNGKRVQFLHQRATTLTPGHLPGDWENARVLLLAPIANEVSTEFINHFPKSLVCVSPQGWLRRWDETGRVYAKTDFNWEKLTGADLIVLSEQDIEGDFKTLEIIIRQAPIVVLTLGHKGATIYHEGKVFHSPSYPVQEIDPTGAGDVFATAFALAYAESEDLEKAAAFAHSAASLNVEATGMGGVPFAIAVADRLRDYRSLLSARK